MFGCESWTIKKAEHWRIDAFELWCWRRLLRVPWIARRSNQPILKEWSESRSVMSNSLWSHGLYSPWNSPGQNTGVGSLSLLQGIFPTQGWNPDLPHGRWIPYQLSRKGSPKENQSWIITGRTDAEAEAPVLWLIDTKSWLIGEEPDAGKDWRQDEKGMTEDKMVGWHHRLNGHELANSRKWWRTEKSGMLQSIGLQRVGHNWATEQ